MLAFVRDLLAHAEWADAVFYHAWGKSPAAGHEELRRRVDHIVVVQNVLMSLLSGQPLPGPAGGPPPSFAELKARAQTAHAGLRDFAATMDAEACSRQVQVTFFPDPPCVITAAEAIVQVAMHTQHH